MLLLASLANEQSEIQALFNLCHCPCSVLRDQHVLVTYQGLQIGEVFRRSGVAKRDTHIPDEGWALDTFDRTLGKQGAK